MWGDEQKHNFVFFPKNWPQQERGDQLKEMEGAENSVNPVKPQDSNK